MGWKMGGNRDMPELTGTNWKMRKQSLEECEYRESRPKTGVRGNDGKYFY